MNLCSSPLCFSSSVELEVQHQLRVLKAFVRLKRNVCNGLGSLRLRILVMEKNARLKSKSRNMLPKSKVMTGLCAIWVG